MEWEIPEPLSIRPCQKPQQMKARQLRSYPVVLKKLPQWVDRATFQISQPSLQQTPNNPQANKQITSQTTEYYSSLQRKYENKQKYQLIYERGQSSYICNYNFAYEYIPTDYVCLENYYFQKAKIQQNSTKNTQEASCSTGFWDGDICFDSRFQCGNLSKAFQVKGKLQYHLIMQNDINTLGYTQWYCFSIKNSSNQPKTIQLKLVNFLKQSSLYKKGMKPWHIKQGSSSWKQLQNKCFYKKTNVKNFYSQYYHELTFEVEIEPGLTFFSMLPLYSYSRLCKNVEKWTSVKGMRLLPKKIYTLLNNIVPILEYVPNSQNAQQQEIKWYDTIVVFARVHPGEVWSSFLAQQFIQTIIHYHKSNSLKIRYLIIPMINPDGVIHGNFRCDYSGVDLNRVWINPNKSTQPSIYNIKKFLLKQFQSKKAKYFLDLHSHSKCYNLFTYTTAYNLIEARLVSDIIRLSNENKIFDPVADTSEVGRNFIVQSQTTYLSTYDIAYSKKRSTARAFMCNLTQKGNSMTIEISFYGYVDKKSGSYQIKPFSLVDFNDFCWNLLKKLLDYIVETQQVILARKILYSIYNSQQQSYLKLVDSQNNVENEPKKKEVFQQNSDNQNQDSDSQPQKYYTNETKKKLKQKNTQVGSIKYLNKLTKKGYMKQTQNMINRIEQIQKQQGFQLQPNTKANTKKLEQLQMKSQNSNQRIIRQKQKKLTPILLEGSPKKGNQKLSQIEIKQIKFQQQREQIPINLANDVKQIKSLKKIFLSKGKKEIKINKKDIIDNYSEYLKVNHGNNGNQHTNSSLGINHNQSNSSTMSKQNVTNIIQPLIFEVIEKQKKHAPIFGKFLTTNKRNQSRRYRSILKEQISIIKNNYEQQRNFMDLIKMKKKENKLKSNPNKYSLMNFLQEEVYKNDAVEISPQTKKVPQYKKQSKIRSIKRVPTQANNLKQTYYQQKSQTLYTKKQQQQQSSTTNPPKKSTKKYSIATNNPVNTAKNQNNKYLIQRKKILDMMKKQTRVYQDTTKQKKDFKQIEDIVQRRKRAKTQISMNKPFNKEMGNNYNQQSNKVFVEHKMLKFKHNQKSIIGMK